MGEALQVVSIDTMVWVVSLLLDNVESPDTPSVERRWGTRLLPGRNSGSPPGFH